MKRIFRNVLIVTLIVSIVCVSSGCSKTDSDLTKVNVSEVAHSIFYAPQYVALEEGYFEEEGLDVKIVNAGGADKVMTSLLSNDADIGFMGSEASIYVYQEGEKDYAVNFAGLTQRAGNFLVAREGNKEFNWKELKGKTVLGGREGGMPQMVFEYILKKNGIDPKKDVNIIQNINFGLTAGAFANGQGDYTVEFEPFATSLELEKEGVVVASLGEDSGYIPYTAYSAKKSYLENNEETVEKFVRAIQKGLDYVNSHDAEEIAQIIKPQFKETDNENLVKIIERYKNQDTWKEDVIFTKESFELLQDVLEDAGQLKERVPYEELVDTDIAKKAIK